MLRALRDLLTEAAKPSPAELLVELERIRAMTPPHALGMSYGRGFGPRRSGYAVSFVVDVTLFNPGREEVDVSVFPWAMLVGQRFYGEPEHEVRAWTDGRFICSKNLETGGERCGRPPR